MSGAGYSTASSSSGGTENGSLTVLKVHTPTWKDAQGQASNGGGSAATSDSEGSAAVTSCVGSCGETITITGNGSGAGYSVTYSPTPLWSDSKHYVNTCPGETLQPISSWSSCPTPVGSPPGPPDEGMQWSWSYTTCNWIQVPNNSPIVIDTTKRGFKFSDVNKGAYVSFDIRGDGTLQKLSWPVAGSGNAWLVYDRDDDGVIKDGTELFGNFTPHSDGGVANHPEPNGFLALAWYDQPAQGGDGNLILDKRDAIWKKLRLWIDGHCYKTPNLKCQSLPQEIFTLESKNITSISLVYSANDKIDSVGNKFRLSAVLNPEVETTPIDERGNSCCDLHQRSKDGRLIYDVWLATAN